MLHARTTTRPAGDMANRENHAAIPNRFRVFLNVIAFIAFAMLTMCSLRAQETRATLSGTVFDPSQATIVGATLRLANVATGVTSTATSNTDGQYRFLFIDPGNYKLSAEAPGFESYVQTGIVLNVSQASTVDIRMKLGSQSDTVTVTSDAPLLETEKSDRGVVLGLRSVEELPLGVRNPIELVEAVPGVTQITQRYDLL
ncbi:MAG: carboxypeptidase-like regulatory domain-containing protein, partial [Formivibrio sp.]|nr:carboxypeptidase-like regulatory domain-containing protein [Formivibrio sp.]